MPQAPFWTILSIDPYYFAYRYGQMEGSAMAAGILEIYRLALWARKKPDTDPYTHPSIQANRDWR